MMGILIFFVLELALIIKAGSHLGAFATISWLFLDMVLGIMLIKYRFAALIKTMHLQDPFRIMEDNLAFLTVPLAGFLLILPGFISDALALIVLIPGMGKLLTCLFAAKILIRHQGSQAFFSSKTRRQDIFDRQDGGVTVDGTCTEAVEDAQGLAHRKIEPKENAEHTAQGRK